METGPVLGLDWRVFIVCCNQEIIPIVLSGPNTWQNPGTEVDSLSSLTVETLRKLRPGPKAILHSYYSDLHAVLFAQLRHIQIILPLSLKGFDECVL